MSGLRLASRCHSHRRAPDIHKKSYKHEAYGSATGVFTTALQGVWAEAWPCAESRVIARAVGATEDERMDLEDALAQRGYIEVGGRPGTVALTNAGRKRPLR